MSEPKVIELTEEQVFDLFTGDDLTIRQRDDAVAAVKNCGLLIKAPQRKQVHLSDLPDGVRIKVIYPVGEFYYYYDSGAFYETKSARGSYSCRPTAIEGKGVYELIQGEWQAWCNVNHWPDGVEVEIECYSPNLHTSPDRIQVKMNASEVAEFVKYRDYVIAIRCIGLMPDYKLVP